jgi:hypothetical protein
MSGVLLKIPFYPHSISYPELLEDSGMFEEDLNKVLERLFQNRAIYFYTKDNIVYYYRPTGLYKPTALSA